MAGTTYEITIKIEADDIERRPEHLRRDHPVAGLIRAFEEAADAHYDFNELWDYCAGEEKLTVVNARQYFVIDGRLLLAQDIEDNYRRAATKLLDTLFDSGKREFYLDGKRFL